MPLSELFRAKYYEKQNSYAVQTNAFHKSYNHLLLKFDTGAKLTTISYAALFNSKFWGLKERIKLKNIIDTSSLLKQKFKAVFGEERIGTLCYIKNPKIGSYYIEKFYFYLTPDEVNPSALLGTDFISCCQWQCNIASDIIVTAFDYHRYNNPFQHISEEQICSLNSLDLPFQNNIFNDCNNYALGVDAFGSTKDNN